MSYLVIYDGNCRLCSGLVELLARWDQGQIFVYSPLQDQQILAQYQLAIADLALGVMLIDLDQPQTRWQGTAAIEQIASLLPNGAGLVDFYRQLQPVKWLGDRIYEQIRDHRYAFFGQRSQTYIADYPPLCCANSGCDVHQE